MKNPWNRPDDFEPIEMQAGASIERNLYDQWMFRGLIQAEHAAQGAGTYSRFSFKNILHAALLVELKKYDIRLKRCSEISKEIADIVEEKGDWGVIYLSWGAGGTQFYTEETVQGRSSCLKLDIDMILSNVCGRIEEAQSKRK
jgi:hypothetical protein